MALFPAAEAKNNYHALATLASIVKSIFLFNEPNIIQLVASDEQVFEECCSCLEYDPDLKEKANHRWFIQERLRFRTVLIMEVSWYMLGSSFLEVMYFFLWIITDPFYK